MLAPGIRFWRKTDSDRKAQWALSGPSLSRSSKLAKTMKTNIVQRSVPLLLIAVAWLVGTIPVYAQGAPTLLTLQADTDSVRRLAEAAGRGDASAFEALDIERTRIDAALAQLASDHSKPGPLASLQRSWTELEAQVATLQQNRPAVLTSVQAQQNLERLALLGLPIDRAAQALARLQLNAGDDCTQARFQLYLIGRQSAFIARMLSYSRLAISGSMEAPVALDGLGRDFNRSLLDMRALLEGNADLEVSKVEPAVAAELRVVLTELQNLEPSVKALVEHAKGLALARDAISEINGSAAGMGDSLLNVARELAR